MSVSFFSKVYPPTDIVRFVICPRWRLKGNKSFCILRRTHPRFYRECRAMNATAFIVIKNSWACQGIRSRCFAKFNDGFQDETMARDMSRHGKTAMRCVEAEMQKPHSAFAAAVWCICFSCGMMGSDSSIPGVRAFQPNQWLTGWFRGGNCELLDRRNRRGSFLPCRG
jgi:hypothetical protein